MTSQDIDELVNKLIDNTVEFDELRLEDATPEELVKIVRTLRGHVLRLSSLVGELSDCIKIVDAFARPKVPRRYIYVAGRERIIQ